MQTTTQVLYRLLENPKCVEPLRQEIEAAVAEEGWTKAGIDRLHRLDSFLRETIRTDTANTGLLDSLNTNLSLITVLQVVLYRLALRPFTFSNGVTIPAGTLITAPPSAIYMDENIYSNADKFDGFRFSNARNMDDDVTTAKYSTVSVSPEHLVFGLGRHAW
jgi:cytochrome P450